MRYSIRAFGPGVCNSDLNLNQQLIMPSACGSSRRLLKIGFHYECCPQSIYVPCSRLRAIHTFGTGK